jgi:hypothetical protein
MDIGILGINKIRFLHHQLIKQRRLQQVRLLGYQRLLGQHNFLGRLWVSAEQTPIDVATVAQVRVVAVLNVRFKF